MSLEKCARILNLVKDARSIAAEVLFSPKSSAAAPKVLLLALLYRIQAMAVSLRADLIASAGGAEPLEGAVPLRSKSAEEDPSQAGQAPSNGSGRCRVIPFDRRRVRPDRRRIPTFIARDRRSGIADRRRCRPPQGAMR